MILTLIGFFALFFAPIIINAVVKDPDKNKKYMKIYIIVFVSCFIWLPMLSTLENKIFNSSSSNETIVADGFTIEGYEVILDVGIDNKVNVTENIDINFYESGHHGIYKYTPYWLEYTGSDNKTIKRKSNILNLRAEDDKYTVDIVNKKERIKIGSAYRTVEGDHKYIIKYTYDMGKDPYSGFDEFIFHAFGDFWGTEIKNPKIVVHLPKDLSNYNVNVFKDKYRKENVNKLINKEIDGSTITITSNDLHLLKSLTVDISLPEGYFVGGSWNYGWGSFIISMIIIILMVYVILSWIKYGRDHEKKVPTVEFYAPDDLSSAEVGYIYNNRHTSKKLTISLIIQLASKGYLKIDEIKDGKRHSKIQISKLHIKPTEPILDSYKIPKRIIEMQKLKEPDDLLSKSGISTMNYFFKEGNYKKLESNIDSFLKIKNELVDGGYISILNDNEKSVNYLKEETGYNKKMVEYEESLKQYNGVVEKLPKKTTLENIVYGNLFSSKDTVILSEHKTFYKTFGEIEKELEKSFKNKVSDDVSRKRKVKAFVVALITLILSLLSFFVVEDMDPSWSSLYYMSFACIFVDLFFAFIMGRKTEYGEYISARIKGFRDFLVTAEKEKLESLVEQNPHYFYDILPYTYVLNISKKWINKFENIKMPEVNMGNFDYSSDVSFHSIFDSVYYPVPTSSSSGRSSGCSSCGGGCSSCGGGCSSCGGGGSW